MRWLSILFTLLTVVGCDGGTESTADPVQVIDESEPAADPDASSDDDVSDTPDDTNEDPPVDPWRRVNDMLGFSDIGALSFAVGTPRWCHLHLP